MNKEVFKIKLKNIGLATITCLTIIIPLIVGIMSIYDVFIQESDFEIHNKTKNENK